MKKGQTASLVNILRTWGLMGASCHASLLQAGWLQQASRHLSFSNGEAHHLRSLGESSSLGYLSLRRNPESERISYAWIKPAQMTFLAHPTIWVGAELSGEVLIQAFSGLGTLGLTCDRDFCWKFQLSSTPLAAAPSLSSTLLQLAMEALPSSSTFKVPRLNLDFKECRPCTSSTVAPDFEEEKQPDSPELEFPISERSSAKHSSSSECSYARLLEIYSASTPGEGPSPELVTRSLTCKRFKTSLEFQACINTFLIFLEKEGLMIGDEEEGGQRLQKSLSAAFQKAIQESCPAVQQAFRIFFQLAYQESQAYLEKMRSNQTQEGGFLSVPGSLNLRRYLNPITSGFPLNYPRIPTLFALMDISHNYFQEAPFWKGDPTTYLKTIFSQWGAKGKVSEWKIFWWGTDLLQRWLRAGHPFDTRLQVLDHQFIDASILISKINLELQPVNGEGELNGLQSPRGKEASFPSDPERERGSELELPHEDDTHGDVAQNPELNEPTGALKSLSESSGSNMKLNTATVSQRVGKLGRFESFKETKFFGWAGRMKTYLSIRKKKGLRKVSAPGLTALNAT